jgi:hypothetical protein
MRLEMDAEQASGVSIEYLGPYDHRQSRVAVHPVSAQDKTQK